MDYLIQLVLVAMPTESIEYLLRNKILSTKVCEKYRLVSGKELEHSPVLVTPSITHFVENKSNNKTVIVLTSIIPIVIDMSVVNA